MDKVDTYTIATDVLQKNLALANTIRCPKCDTDDIDCVQVGMNSEIGGITHSTLYKFLCNDCETHFKVRSELMIAPMQYLPCD